MRSEWKDVGDSVREILKPRKIRLRAMSTEEVPSASTEPIKNNRGLWLTGLLILAVTLALAILAIKKQEAGGFVVDNPNPAVSTIVEVAPSNSEIVEKINVLDKRLSVVDKKVMLLGAANNNNWWTLANGKEIDDVVYFGSDWKLNKMPKHISMTEEQKALFRQWVR